MSDMGIGKHGREYRDNRLNSGTREDYFCRDCKKLTSISHWDLAKRGRSKCRHCGSISIIPMMDCIKDDKE